MCEGAGRTMYLSDALLAWARCECLHVKRLKWFWIVQFENCTLRFGREWAELDTGKGNIFHLNWKEGDGFARFIDLARFGRML